MYSTPLAQVLAALPPLTETQAIAATRRTFAAHPERAFALLLPPTS